MRRHICWPCALGRCAWCTGCSCPCSSRASIVVPLVNALVLSTLGAFFLIVSQMPSQPAPERTYHTRPATEAEIQQHELDQQTAQLFAEMEAQR